MSAEQKPDEDDRKRRFEENVPPPRILKIALLAAAIIVIIAILVYLKARHAPPALHDDLWPPVSYPKDEKPGNLRAISCPRMPFDAAPEVALWNQPQTQDLRTS